MSGPYRLFNRDLNPHNTNNITELYGSIPYMLSHGSTGTYAVAWMNSADTWVDLWKDTNHTRYAGFVSEGGAIEFFLMGSAVHPKLVHK